MKFNYINDLSVKIMGITLRFVKFNYINGLSVKIMGITVRFVNYNKRHECYILCG